MRVLVVIFLTLTLLFCRQNSMARLHTVHAEWRYQPVESLLGFRLYHEHKPLCEILSPTATTLDCELDIETNDTWFTITSLFTNGLESLHSPPFYYSFSPVLQAIIDTDTTEGNAPLAVEFSATSSTGDIAALTWSFGDGTVASGETVLHTFSAPGNYTVTLEVTDTSGATETDDVVVAVTSAQTANTAPVAIISSSKATGETPLTVLFDGLKSYDTDGNITLYSWVLGDNSTATGALISHTYYTAGTYYPTLTVQDDSGATHTVSTPIIVLPQTSPNISPVAVCTASIDRGSAPLSIRFSGLSSIDPDGTLSTYRWDFGDGTTALGSTVNHTFHFPATFLVKLLVTDNKGAVSKPAILTVTVQAPGVSFNPATIPIIINFLLMTTPDK